ncbi:NUDIX hydrolase [Halostella sp. JP-L12]|uniref:NUDIX hydrolase n=1 Tax=Halostella TaxID=1843185 RepID=UPI000EF763FD|nr:MULTISPECIES: NUDIX hydrolase [Halostella]NHN46921.1 NUDIX hydrolase [Halostella sp. JP-L12]
MPDDAVDPAANDPTASDGLAWQTLDSRVAYTCPGFDVVQEDVRLPDGTETDFDYLSEGESVVVLPFTPEGDVVVIEEWRQAVDRVNRALPAGGLEQNDDDLPAAVRRELTEETGYEADAVEHLVTVEPANGFSDAVFHYFVARDCTATGEQDLDDNETIRVDTTPFDSLLAAVRENEIRDGRTALGVMYYALFE